MFIYAHMMMPKTITDDRVAEPKDFSKYYTTTAVQRDYSNNANSYRVYV